MTRYQITLDGITSFVPERRLRDSRLLHVPPLQEEGAVRGDQAVAAHKTEDDARPAYGSSDGRRPTAARC